MNGEQLSSWRTYHQLTQQQLADALGVDRVTLARWETAQRAIPSYLGLALETIQRELPKRHKKIIREANPRSVRNA